jgi:hypothetical protein
VAISIQRLCGGAAAARHQSVMFFVNIVGIQKDLVVKKIVLDISIRILLNIINSFGPVCF